MPFFLGRQRRICRWQYCIPTGRSPPRPSLGPSNRLSSYPAYDHHVNCSHSVSDGIESYEWPPLSRVVCCGVKCVVAPLWLESGIPLVECSVSSAFSGAVGSLAPRQSISGTLERFSDTASIRSSPESSSVQSTSTNRIERYLTSPVRVSSWRSSQYA